MKAKKKECACGCGRKFTDPDIRRKYYLPECYPSKRKKLEQRMVVCECGCGISFTTSRGNQRYYSKKCADLMAEVSRNIRGEAGPPMVTKKLKSFRDTICRKKRPFGIEICKKYSECSDSVITKGKWEFEMNGGVNCFV